MPIHERNRIRFSRFEERPADAQPVPFSMEWAMGTRLFRLHIFTLFAANTDLPTATEKSCDRAALSTADDSGEYKREALPNS